MQQLQPWWATGAGSCGCPPQKAHEEEEGGASFAGLLRPGDIWCWRGDMPVRHGASRCSRAKFLCDRHTALISSGGGGASFVFGTGRAAMQSLVGDDLLAEALGAGEYCDVSTPKPSMPLIESGGIAGWEAGSLRVRRSKTGTLA